jgi:hyperosmotically inducible protein
MARMNLWQLAVALGCALSLLAGCEQKGTAEKAGEKADKAMQKTGDKIQETAKEAERKVKEATK